MTDRFCAAYRRGLPADEIAGLNRMWRQLLVDGIKADPAWAKGNYQKQPLQGLRTAASMLIVAGAAPLNLQTHFPTHQPPPNKRGSGGDVLALHWTPTI